MRMEPFFSTLEKQKLLKSMKQKRAESSPVK
jgi:hypothetical protein